MWRMRILSRHVRANQVDKAERAAFILCKLGETHLWQPRIKWAQQLVPGINLYFRVGSGKQTCHTVRGDAHSITIGAECIREALHSPKRASAWLSYDELKQHKYFGHRIQPAEIMVHTLCHEFGHFVQTVLGRRMPGQQHDQVFYAILGRIHGGGHATKLLTEFKLQCSRASIPLEFEDTTRNFIHGRLGERILARTAGRIIAGRVVKQNRRSVVVGIPHQGHHHRVRVSPCLIEPDSGLYRSEPTEWR